MLHRLSSTSLRKRVSASLLSHYQSPSLLSLCSSHSFSRSSSSFISPSTTSTSILSHSPTPTPLHSRRINTTFASSTTILSPSSPPTSTGANPTGTCYRHPIATWAYSPRPLLPSFIPPSSLPSPSPPSSLPTFPLSSSSSYSHRNLYILGPPGSGKSSVVSHLSNLLNMSVLDVDDDWLEKRWGCSVAEKLKELGDEKFVEEEGRQMLELKVRNTIVSLSGSNPLHPYSLHYLSLSGLILYLDPPLSEIEARCSSMKIDRIVGQSTRGLSSVLRERQSIYENSYDVRVMIEGGQTPKQIAHKIAKTLMINQNYQSTRGYSNDPATGSTNGLEFVDVVKRGLAPDRGLFVSNDYFPFSPAELSRLLPLSYPEQALRVMEKFPLGSLHPSHLRSLLYSAYSTFSHPSILPVSELGEKGQYLMETYHGPTASFKDLSLQLLPKLLDASMKLKPEKNKNIVGLLVATSGDTGTAALDGFTRIANTPVIVLYPLNGVSIVQKAQMQTCESENVCVIGIEGDFDFCQTTVKDIFNDSKLNEEFHSILPGLTLSSANSINWGRFLPQLVFTFSSYLSLVNQKVIQLGDQVDVCIPTGNFGNMLGAVYAKKLGLPLRKLITASNDNNIIADFVKTGIYDTRASTRTFRATVSPSIDILVSSNLERLLYVLSGGNTRLISSLFNQLQKEGVFRIEGELLEAVQKEIIGEWCGEKECLETVRQVWKETGKMIDPHTAVAVAVASRVMEKQEKGEKTVPMLVSSTAHFAKFPNAMLAAYDQPIPSSDMASMFTQLMSLPHDPIHSTIHPELAKLVTKEKKHVTQCGASKEAVAEEIRKFLREFAKRV